MTTANRMATIMKKRKPEMCIPVDQSKIPNTAPIAPKSAPKTPARIPAIAPNTPAISPNNPPRIPIQKGNVMINKMTTSTEEFDEVFVVMTSLTFRVS